MLNKEQKEAFEKGVELYQEACHWEDELCDERLDLLFEAFETMGDFVDEVDDIYYKVVFANIIQDMQNCKQFNLSPSCQVTKIHIYLQALKWFENTDSFSVKYAPFLESVFFNLGKILLKGDEELEQNDNVARICYENIKLLKQPLSSLIDALFLQHFIQDDVGKWVFTAIRPN